MNQSVLVVFIPVVLFTSCKRKKEEWVSPTISPITEAVFAPGHIKAANQFTLTAINDGYLNNVLVEEGDIVSKNQILFEQDHTTATIQQQASDENLRIAHQQASENSAVLQQLQEQLASANQKLRNDQTQLGRMQRLYTTNSVAKVDVDNAQLSYDNSLNNVNAIKQSIAATKLNLQQTVVNSRSQQQTALANKNYYNIKSPGDYKVFTLFKKKGELVRKGEAVAILGNGTELKVILSIDEASVAKIKLEQKVLIELNTEKGKTYTASVSKIYPAFDVTTQAYTIEAAFDTVHSHIINGTLLQANIIVSHKDKAMLIPRSCLNGDGKALIKTGNKKDTITVQTGIISFEWVEVLSGISANDKILKTFLP